MCFTIFNKIYKAYIVTFVVVGKVLKPGPNRTVRPGKPWTDHFYGLLNMKNRSMSKNSEPYRPRSDRRFCEPWAVQEVHTGPLFQALNGTVLDSLPCFFFLYRVVTLDFGIGSFFQTRNPRLTLSIKKPSINTSRNSKLGRYGVWTVKLKSQPKKINK